MFIFCVPCFDSIQNGFRDLWPYVLFKCTSSSASGHMLWLPSKQAGYQRSVKVAIGWRHWGGTPQCVKPMHHSDPLHDLKKKYKYTAVTWAVLLSAPAFEKLWGQTRGHQSVFIQALCFLKRDVPTASPHHTLVWWLLCQQTRGVQLKHARSLFFSLPYSSGIFFTKSTSASPWNLAAFHKFRGFTRCVCACGPPKTQELRTRSFTVH